MTTLVVNIKSDHLEPPHAPADVMVGRPGKWGNPFVIGKDGTREQVIAKHAQWVWTQPELIAARHELRGLVLGCYCKPLPCHGDTLAKLADMRSCAIVCGGRDYFDGDNVCNMLSKLVATLKIDCIVTGGAPGADELGHAWAYNAGLLAAIEPAKWALQGKAAGGIRNQLMLDKYPVSIVIAFPGGTGTADMVRRSITAGVPIVAKVSATGEISYV